MSAACCCTCGALTQAGRGLAYMAAAELDIARRSGDAAAMRRVDLLTPIVKGWCTDLGNEVASLGVQVHGGMGFIEETGRRPAFPGCAHHAYL